MERKLFIIRHGKSSWETVVDDIDRPLTERGVRNSYEMADRLQESGLLPKALYSSPANRALHTAVIMSRVWKTAERNMHICKDLYLSDEDDIQDVISGLPDEITEVAIFGHNPGFTGFANRYLRPPVENIPTAGVVVLVFEMDSWTDMAATQVKQSLFDYPKKNK